MFDWKVFHDSKNYFCFKTLFILKSLAVAICYHPLCEFNNLTLSVLLNILWATEQKSEISKNYFQERKFSYVSDISNARKNKDKFLKNAEIDCQQKFNFYVQYRLDSLLPMIKILMTYKHALYFNIKQIFSGM